MPRPAAMIAPLAFGLALALARAPRAAEVEPLPFDPAALAKAPQVEVRVKERGATVVYAGVPLRAALEGKLGDAHGEMAALRSLADAVVLVRAGDGYRAAASAAEVAMDRDGAKYLLALRRDGKPLGPDEGPVRLIVPGDPLHVRWVRMVTALDLVRPPKRP